MKPIGKTFLIKAKRSNEQYDNVGGIFVPNSSGVGDIYFEGTLQEYGIGWSDEELKNFPKLGSNVYFDYTKKEGKTKVVLGEGVFYIINEKDLLAVKEEE